MLCPKCGYEFQGDEVYCPGCGCMLEDSKPSVTEAPWSEKTIDDLYFAAIEGRAADVKEIVDHQPRLLTEIISADSGDGITSSFTVVFSILSKYNENELNVEVLDILYNAGVDFNQAVTLDYNSGHKSTRFLLYYPVAVWENPGMTRYLLDHGANPDSIVEDNVNSPGMNMSYTPLLYFAITECANPGMTDLLLSYGADPKICATPFVEDLNTYQNLPMLYYAAVTEASVEKTALLFHYGANPQDTVNTGGGMRGIINFYKYIGSYYPASKSVVDRALKQAKAMPPSQVKRVYSKPGNNGQSSGAADTANSKQRPQVVTKTVNNKINDRVLKKCYNRFVAYLFANFCVLGLGFGIIGPIILAANDQGMAAVGLLIFGIPCILIAAGIGFAVYMVGKSRGQIHFFGEFVFDSIKMYGFVLLCMSIILIPFAVSIARNSGDWSYRQTTDGREVYVRQTGEGVYEDDMGREYRKKKDD